jgi:hypothetical protein
VLKNEGSNLHGFVLGTPPQLEEHAALMVKFPNVEHDEPDMAHVPPGQAGEIVWTFNRAGDFDFACPIAGHDQAGKVGKVKVTASHTARVAGYAIEGHVPAAGIRRLLKERPKATGLAVPGMPVGSPGMDGPAYKGCKDPCDVLLIAADGNASIYPPHRCRPKATAGAVSSSSTPFWIPPTGC